MKTITIIKSDQTHASSEAGVTNERVRESMLFPLNNQKINKDMMESSGYLCDDSMDSFLEVITRCPGFI